MTARLGFIAAVLLAAIGVAVWTTPSAATPTVEAASFATICGIEIDMLYHGERSPDLRACFLESHQRGQPAELMLVGQPRRGPTLTASLWSTRHGIARLVEMEQHFVDDRLLWRTEQTCTQLESAGGDDVFAPVRCSSPIANGPVRPVAIEVPQLCGMQTSSEQLGGRNEAGEACLRDALAAGLPARFYLVNLNDLGSISHVYTVLSRDTIEVYTDDREWKPSTISITRCRVLPPDLSSFWPDDGLGCVDVPQATTR